MKCVTCDCDFEEEIREHWSGRQLWLVCPKCKIEILIDEDIP
jgi:hypothetical protein